MKLLVDNQLPVALARYLAANGWECQHVQDIALDSSGDHVIWQVARERGLVIVTKDEDFQILSNQQGGGPPQVIWVRLGNCRKAALLEAFASVMPGLREMLEAGNAVIEIR